MSGEFAARVGQLVGVESPSGDAIGLQSCMDLVAAWGLAALGRRPVRPVVDGVPHLAWPAEGPGSVLLLGHLDTVWPRGTLASWPFAIREGLASGPGVFDMKAGVVELLAAVAGLAGDRDRVGVLLTGDEEVGSTTSRHLIEEQAGGARAVLVLEPSAPGGAAKTARKGRSGYRLTVHGRSAHAGLDPETGVNATVELARLVLAAAGMAEPSRGTTVTPTVCSAGTTVNTVPDQGVVDVDVRAWTAAEQQRVDAALRALAPVDPRARVEVTGGLERGPLEESASAGLLARASAVAGRAGLPPLAGSRVGGGSDGNLTAALGIPTLDGLGAVGGGAHAREEWVDLAATEQRAGLVALLIDDLLGLPA